MIRRTFLTALGLLPFVPKAKAEAVKPAFKKAVMFSTDMNRHVLVLLADPQHNADYLRFDNGIELVRLHVGLDQPLHIKPQDGGYVTWTLGTYGLALPPHVFTGTGDEVRKEFDRIVPGRQTSGRDWSMQQLYTGCHFYIRHETVL